MDENNVQQTGYVNDGIKEPIPPVGQNPSAQNYPAQQAQNYPVQNRPAQQAQNYPAQNYPAQQAQNYPAQNYPAQNYPAQNYQMPVRANMGPTSYPGKGLGIASMVIGIVSLVAVCSFGGYTGIVGLILGAVALSQSKKAGYNNGMAVAGLVLSIIAVSLLVLGWLGVFGAGSYLEWLERSFERSL
ncbi:MAG: DUF4190 domain-containing protein [Clostridia bacterium]|nr:DUF4190 domain-containing protein [Clostridia bacterium]